MDIIFIYERIPTKMNHLSYFSHIMLNTTELVEKLYYNNEKKDQNQNFTN